MLSSTFTLADDNDFLAAREAYRVSDMPVLAEYSTKLQGDLFGVYADYYLLSRQLDKVDSIAVMTFLQKYPETWLAEKLRGEWLLLLAKRQDWQNYRQFYSGLARPEPEHKCYSYTARIKTDDKIAAEEARTEFWFITKDLPTPCDELLMLLQQTDVLTQNDYLLRFRLALQNGNVSLARVLAGKLGIDVTPKLIEQMAKNPQKYLARPDVETAIGHEL